VLSHRSGRASLAGQVADHDHLLSVSSRHVSTRTCILAMSELSAFCLPAQVIPFKRTKRTHEQVIKTVQIARILGYLREARIQTSG
jgi:hypothetical protein